MFRCYIKSWFRTRLGHIELWGHFCQHLWGQSVYQLVGTVVCFDLWGHFVCDVVGQL